MQLGHPGADERLHRLRCRRACRARRPPCRGRSGCRREARGASSPRRRRRPPPCPGPSPRPGRSWRGRPFATHGACRPDVDRDQAPAARDGARDPVGRELRVRAGPVGPADVDPEGPVGRGEPGLERLGLRRVAGVERIAAEGRRLAAAGGRRARSPRRLRARGSRPATIAAAAIAAAPALRCLLHVRAAAGAVLHQRIRATSLRADALLASRPPTLQGRARSLSTGYWSVRRL